MRVTDGKNGMEYITDITDFHMKEPTVISLGKFDGLHRGHECLLDYLALKKKQGLRTVIFTFDIPPSQKLDAKSRTKVLTTNEEKQKLFLRHGIDCLMECPFTEELRCMEPEDFVEMLVKRLCMKSMAAGTDFHFGYNRRGDYKLLQTLAEAYGYEVEIIEKVRENGRDISSTYIREEISGGHIEKANQLLGYSYFVQGTVVHGKEIGRTLNIPTLNLLPPEEKLLPPFGVYVTRTMIDGRAYAGITNVGCKPTIAGANPTGVETHLFDFQEMMYGKEIIVEFLHSVRPEKKFHSLEELKAQMERDIAFGRRYCKGSAMSK